jgi:hypothetical protein
LVERQPIDAMRLESAARTAVVTRSSTDVDNGAVNVVAHSRPVDRT